MSKFSNILRGGQVQIHQFRMAKQILGVAFTFSILVGLIAFSYFYNKSEEKFYYNDITTYMKSKAITSIIPPKFTIGLKIRYGNTSLEDSPYTFLANPLIKYRTITYFTKLKAFALKALATSILSYFLIMILWLKLGNLKGRSSEQKGVYQVDEVKKFLKKNDLLSELKLSELPLVKNKETSHILLAGSSGTGKTNCILSLCKQIRKFNQNAIIVDLTSQYIDLFYDPEKDFILNPLDSRTAYWDLWKEISCKEKLSLISEALFAGDNQSNDKFWSESAKTIFEDSVMAFQENDNTNYHSLYQMLAVDDLKTLHKTLKNTASASLIDPKNEKTAFSIRSVVTTYSKSIKYLEDMKLKGEKFSIEDWMNNIDGKNKDSWLFLSASPKQRGVMKPLIRMWMDIALASLMNLPSSYTRRVWFIMDEMPVLGKLPSLSPMLSEARKYGGCIISGIQSISQVYESYGHHGANIVIDSFATKIFFRVTGTENTNKIARIFGQEEQEEVNENITYGAHEMRDGVSISRHQKNKLIVTEKDIIKLKDLEAYALLPCEVNIVKVKFKYFQT